MKYAFIEKYTRQFKVSELCQAMQVSQSGYYYWQNNKLTYKEQIDAYLTHLIKQIHSGAKGRYGSPRILSKLKELGEKVSRKRINRLMKEHNIYAKGRGKFRIITNSKHNHLIAPNLLKQNFAASLPNQVWVADITYVWTQEGWLYLAVILDLYSRMVVGWSVSDRIKKELVIDAFLKYYWTRKPKPGLIHHSDRGSQYASNDFQKILGNAGVIASMSGKGNCYDNAVAESFFKSLKTKLGKDVIFKTKEEAKSATFEYVEAFYNPVRKHSTLHYCSPIKFEQYLLNMVA